MARHVLRNQAAIFLRPVPATNIVYLDIDAPANIELYNLSGTKFKSGFVHSSTLEVSDLRSGVYILRMIDTDTGEVWVKKFIKQ